MGACRCRLPPCCQAPAVNPLPMLSSAAATLQHPAIGGLWGGLAGRDRLSEMRCAREHLRRASVPARPRRQSPPAGAGKPPPKQQSIQCTAPTGSGGRLGPRTAPGRVGSWAGCGRQGGSHAAGARQRRQRHPVSHSITAGCTSQAHEMGARLAPLLAPPAGRAP